VTELIVEHQLTGTRDGITQLQRRWRPADGEPTGVAGVSAAGAGAAGVSAAVLLVHGIGEHSGRYDHVGRYLAARRFDVMAFDCRGHGQSGGRRGHLEGFNEHLDDVEDLIVERRQLGVPVVLIGHSLGGLISASYVVSGRPSPDLLVLSAPALGAAVPRWQRAAARTLCRVAPRVFVKSEIDPEVLSRDPGVQQAYVEDPLLVAGATARLGQEILTAMAQTSASIDRITIPTYVLHGGDDQLVPPEHSRPLAALANVTYRLWPGLRHECLNEPEQAEVLAELVGWLDARLAATGRSASASS
jgi:alpha-beta hydrolase superfamily lysophospholipase